MSNVKKCFFYIFISALFELVFRLMKNFGGIIDEEEQNLINARSNGERRGEAVESGEKNRLSENGKVSLNEKQNRSLEYGEEKTGLKCGKRNYFTVSGEMKGAAKSTVKAAALVLFVIVAFLHVRSVGAAYGVPDWLGVAKSLYDVCGCEKPEEFSALAEKARLEIYYANAKTSDKYRLRAILEYVENGIYNANAKNIREVREGIFGSCKTFKGREFYASCKRFYDQRLSSNAGATADAEKVEKEVCDRADRSNGTIASGADENKVRSKNRVFFAETKAVKQSRSMGELILTKGTCKKYSAAQDNSIWFYGDNYVFASFVGSQNDLILLSEKGSVTGDGTYRFKNKNIFEKGRVCRSFAEADGAWSRYRISSSSEDEGVILETRYTNAPRLVCYSFEDYTGPCRK